TEASAPPPPPPPPPPPTGSPFQQEVTYYVNTILGLASGSILNVDQISLIVTSGLSGLLDPSVTCPMSTSNPPLTDLTSLPSPLVLPFDFGAGCVVQDGSAAPPTLGGMAVVTATNLVIGETSISGTVEIALNNITVNGLPVASGTVAATFNVNIALVGESI